MGLFSRAPAVTEFPAVSGRRHDGSIFTIPADLNTEATLLVVLFRDGLDVGADQWNRLALRLGAAYDGRLVAYEMTVHSAARKLLGNLSLPSVEPGVDGDNNRARTVAIYVDKQAFRTELRVDDPGEVHVFLVDRDGTIAWRGEGAIDMDEVDGLERALSAMLQVR